MTILRFLSFQLLLYLVQKLDSRSLLQSTVEHSQWVRVDNDWRDGNGGLYYGY